MLLNARDYSSLEAALADASDGDSIYAPSGIPYVAPAGGLQVTKSIDLFGDGMGVDTSTGTILRAADSNSPVIKILTPATNVRVRDLQLQRGGAGPGSGVGVQCLVGGSDTADTVGLMLSRLRVNSFPSHGIVLSGSIAHPLRSVALLDLIVGACGGSGVAATNAFDVQALSSTFASNLLSGMSVDGGTLAMKACGFKGNAAAPGLTDPEEGNLKLVGCEMVDVEGCSFSDLQVGSIRTGIVCRNTVGLVGNSTFDSTALDPACIGIRMRGTSGGPGVIMGNRYSGVSQLILIEEGVAGIAIYPQYDAGVSGKITLPWEANSGIYGAPHIVRDPFGTPYGLGGFLLPMVWTTPAAAYSRDGMLAYKRSGSESHVIFRTGGQWHRVETTP